MRKSCAIVLFLLTVILTRPAPLIGGPIDEEPNVNGPAASPTDDENDPDDESEPQYPIAVAVGDGEIFTVDLDLPGIWRTDQSGRTLWRAGSPYLRKTLNRPRPVVMHPEGGIIVGDSATREVYHLVADQPPRPLQNGFLGIPMALAVSPDRRTLYIGDAERRAVFRIPLAGLEDEQTPELVTRTNARGLAFDDQGNLYALTPDADAVVRIDIGAKTVETVLGDRPFGYPGGLAWKDGVGYVSDVYGKKIWKFTADANVETFFEGNELQGPVLIAAGADSLYVPDPKSKRVLRLPFDGSNPTSVLDQLP